jgi:hypothetical protein
MNPAPSVDDAVSEWLHEFSLPKDQREGGVLIWDACRRYPEIAWEAILRLLQRPLTDEQFSMLAAGPMEDLLCYHGAEVIERVEARAATDPKFRELLGGVWQRSTPADVWGRVETVRGEPW